MIKSYADMHCHSTCSDGTLSPIELITLAKSIGLKGLSITDHDTIKAYETALPAAKEIDIDLLPGIEFSANHEGTSVHVLGYAFSPLDPAIVAFCEKHEKRRKQRNEGILERLRNMGMMITMEDVVAEGKVLSHTIGRPHIAEALLQKGYVKSIQEAFKKYIGEGKPCHIKGSFFTVEETLQTIHQAQGLAVIAHPHLIEESELVHQLLEMPFDGIECYYGNFAKKQNQRWIKSAEKKGLLKTGGSDYHGLFKPHISLGCSCTEEETFNIFLKHYLSHRR